ncbi:MAG: hypothetical protein AUG09_03080 [Acidobacteria bacterium 13_1_20CM_2_68_7]|nr:MAG: hypothetical protein AUG09_03080 [Acidobacteria bacterium 13_1_20CM_2_68_7]
MEARKRALQRLISGGTIPVFPLPDLVFFPHASLPLHIFEPRYRKMTQDALRGERLIALALLNPGWERDYDGNPAIAPLGCAGLIEDDVRLPDGRFNIRLRGLARIEFLSFVQESPYRIARVRVLEDRNDQDGPQVEEDKKRLMAVCAGLLQEFSGRDSQAFALDNAMPFAAAVNTLCQSLAMEPREKIALLGLDDVRDRCRGLLGILEERWREISLRQARRQDPTGRDVH